jgi:hypothetical protein
MMLTGEREVAMRHQIVRFFNNLPIERKLLLTSVIPLIALVLSSVLTYRGVRTVSAPLPMMRNSSIVSI